MRLGILPLLAALLFAGCAPPGFIPQPTKKQVKRGDVIGAWHLQQLVRMTETGPLARCGMTIEFKPDGLYSQQITVEGQTNVITQTGAWKLEGSHITFTDLLQEGWDERANRQVWEKSMADWYMIDVNFGKDLGLFGSLHGDPDTFQWMERKR